jgi:TRAP-type C4-dicarboxylate transport system permease small subunit
MRLHNGLLLGIEYFAGVILAIDVAVVFLSVIMRYFLHEPFDWAEEVAGILMVMLIFLGAASVVGRQKHVGIDVFLGLFPASWRAALIQCGLWIEVAVSLLLLVSTVDLWLDTQGQTTPIGFPQWMVLTPVIIGSLAMFGFAMFNALAQSGRVFWGTLAAVIGVGVAVAAWNILAPDHAIPPILLLIIGFIGSILMGVPIAFGIAFAAAVYFLANPTLPTLIYSQQLVAGANHFVLLAIPFFVLAGVAMESNGMSSRLIELLVRMMGRLRGGLNLIIIVAGRVLFRRVRFQAGRHRGRRRNHHARCPPHQAGSERGRRPAGMLGCDGRDDPAVRQHDHLRLRRQHLDRRVVHGRRHSGIHPRARAGWPSRSTPARRSILPRRSPNGDPCCGCSAARSLRSS